jgi:hypothetical protein
LARRAAGDDIDPWSLLSEPPVRSGSDIVMAGNLRPVGSEDLVAVGVELHLSDRGHAGTLQPQFETADTAEQAEDVHSALSGW